MSTDNRPYGDLADLVRRTRRAVEMTQRQLSGALGKSEGYVGHLESGRFQPTVETLKALASVFGISYGRLAVGAGYITQEQFENPIDATELARLNEVRDLTDEEFESVKDFARYIISKRGDASGR